MKLEQRVINIITKIPPFGLLFTLLVLAALLNLGFWQSDRAQEKEARLQNIQHYAQTSPLALGEVLAELEQNGLHTINDYPIQIQGTFVPDILFFLDNQVEKGRLGYRVFQVFTQGKYALLVNLGWVAGSINRDILPEISPIEGRYTLKGNVRVIEKGIQLQEQNFSQVSWPLRVQQIELVKFSQIISQELLPFVVYLDKKETIGYKKNWQPIVMPPEKHRAYAFQWFALAFAWMVLMTVAWVKVTHKNNNKK